ncbi:MAG: hypothetical protein IK011_07185 [Bacteroidaceae bacterium]|nr:hypothetical protein [Bacteroidaceae bacterium]
MKKTALHTFASFAALVCATILFCGCEKLTVPTIEDTSVTETTPGVIRAQATMTSKEIDDYGLIYSTKNSSPTLASKEGTVQGTLEGSAFTAEAMLKTNTTYYFVFYATNEVGTTYSTAIKLTTSLYSPSIDDNPMPNL